MFKKNSKVMHLYTYIHIHGAAPLVLADIAQPLSWASLVTQMIKNLPAVQETWVQSLGQEDPWRRKWLPIPVFLPGEFYGHKSLAGYSPWGHKELNMTE